MIACGHLHPHGCLEMHGIDRTARASDGEGSARSDGEDHSMDCQTGVFSNELDDRVI